MKRRSTFLKSLVGGITLGLVLGAGGSAVAAETVYTTWANFTAGPTTFTARAYITPAGTSGIQVKKLNGASSTQNYLAANVSEWSQGTLRHSTGIVYNSSTVVAHIVQHPRHFPLGGNFQASGTAYAYNSSTGAYVSKVIVKTPIQTLP